MKRSELNRIIQAGIDDAAEKGICLPPFAFWTPETWENLGEESREIIDTMLGWDVTDFGSGRFDEVGLLIFTFRNGNYHHPDRYPKPYAEKLLLVKDEQELPFHFHYRKMEDIINRGGGSLEIQLYNSDSDGERAGGAVTVSVDGTKKTVAPGGTVFLEPGQSITLVPGQYHRWVGHADRAGGFVSLFEVSSVNDDREDNHFYSAPDRLPHVEEDERPKFFLFQDYASYVKMK